MAGDEQIKEFLRNFAAKIENIERCIDYCKANQDTLVSEINVISTAILGILHKIRTYLNFVEEEAKPLLIDFSWEWNQVKEKVINPFIKGIKSEELIRTYEK